MENLVEPVLKDGVLLVVSGPSGVGKGTVIKSLMRSSIFELSISATTRAPREGEVDGRDYHFVAREVFWEKVKNGEFLEYAEYCGNLYGTLLSSVMLSLKKKRCLILEIDVEGFIKLKRVLPNNKFRQFAGVFIKPPSISELERRLKTRGVDDIAVINERVLRATEEIACSEKYDFVVTNYDPEACADEIRGYFFSKFVK